MNPLIDAKWRKSPSILGNSQQIFMKWNVLLQADAQDDPRRFQQLNDTGVPHGDAAAEENSNQPEAKSVE